MAKIDINSILKKPVSGFKSDLKNYSLADLNDLLYALKQAIDSPENDEATENKIASFIESAEKQISKLGDIKKRNGVSAEEASANLASILGFGVKPQTPVNAVKHKLDDRKSIKDIAKKINPTKQASAPTPAPAQTQTQPQPPQQQKKQKPKGLKTGKSGQFLLFGIEPEQPKEVDEIVSNETIKNDKQLSLNFNQKVKKQSSKAPSQALVLRERAISLKEAQLEETKRRHAAVESLEHKHLEVRNKESLRINQREKESNRVRLEVSNLELEKAKMKSESAREMQERKLKAVKSIQTSKARATIKKEQMKAESADKRSEMARDVKLAQLKYKQERDDQKRKDSAERREERERNRQNRLKQGKRDKTYGFLKDLSPTTAYAYKFATGGFGRSTSKETKDDVKSISPMAHIIGGLLARDVTKGVFSKTKGMFSKLGTGMWGATKGLGSKSLEYGSKAMGSPLGKGVGGFAMKGMSKIPLVGGLISALGEYSSGGGIGRSIGVGAGAMAGSAVGAAAGAVFGPPGILIGGILGGILGQMGVKDIMNMFLGDKPPSTVKPLPSNITPSSNGASSSTVPSGEATERLSSLEQKYGLPSGLLDSVWSAESGRGRNMKSSAGAEGHFQFMPATAKEYGLQNPYDFNESSEAAAKYYSVLLKRYNGDVDKAVAAYNWGMGNVDKKGLSNLPEETRGYLAKVKGGMSLAVSKPTQQSRVMAESNSNISSQRLENATTAKEQADKNMNSVPQPVVLAGGSTNVGGNTTNNTIINAPETDSLIRQLSYINMKPLAGI